MVKVSVLIPTYNCARYLPEALDSVIVQTYQDLEILVIDDGSSDNTKSIVKGYVARYPDRIRYFYQENQGQAVARNRGIGESRGAYIALLDADDLWLPNRLEDGVKILDDKPDIALVHSNVTKISEDGRPIETPKRNNAYLSGSISDHLITQKAHVSSPTVLFRKACLEKAGLFDENLARMGSEDRDLWIRITMAYKACYIDKVLAYYRVRPGQSSSNSQSMLDGIRYVIDKYCPYSRCGQWMRKRALSKVYRDMGDEFLYASNFAASAKLYWKALRLEPVSFWPWVNIGKALLKVKVRQ